MINTNIFYLKDFVISLMISYLFYFKGMQKIRANKRKRDNNLSGDNNQRGIFLETEEINEKIQKEISDKEIRDMQENKNEEDETFDEADLNDYDNITLLHTH